MRSHQAECHLAFIKEDVVVQRYSDRTLVLVTQLGKIGNLIQASIPPTTGLPPLTDQLPPPLPAIHLTPLLGSASSEHVQTLHSLYVSQIATLVWVYDASSAVDTGRKAVVVGLALKKLSDGDEGLTEDEKLVFREVMNLVQDMLKQYSSV
ncbi:hypothetical protein Agabi119p4_3013 [Agaricus bisporus var. burnettii]|uniref:Proteasome assembly chaperone 3 n=1 Tax=Agaricus bisporus var. burnettii TaxID=192524 RepID=A0A8H7F6G8_AGABI|nr:hypothetical protein Agabi119p4_3013 [Agaricus bisporus var. burnettii]